MEVFYTEHYAENGRRRREEISGNVTVAKTENISSKENVTTEGVPKKINENISTIRAIRKEKVNRFGYTFKTKQKLYTEVNN